MNLKNQKRLAASILNVGVNRVWLNPEALDDLEVAITRDEIRKLIHDGAIKALRENAQSKGRTRALTAKKKAKRRIGPGSRKGKKFSVVSRKERWMARIRAQRKKLRDLKDRRIIAVKTYRNLYMKAKGGEFRSIAEMERYINENNLRRRTFG